MTWYLNVLKIFAYSIYNFLWAIGLLAILQKSLDWAIFLYTFIREVGLSDVRASITIVHIQKFYNCLKISFDSDSF